VRGLLNEFIREYFLHVHPNLPVINEADFWDTYTNNRREPVPLILFQAMLFAACSVRSSATLRYLIASYADLGVVQVCESVHYQVSGVQVPSCSTSCFI
jgi:hypothetical protein